ncbi:amino acid permease [archaeon]|jgi:basic amino acid/polyamine antiporter, APA family|nr:amino acid permease [archaeon]MBT4022498.1 amino acid permease [archaeon]MBT4272337.1 amino acid permease [archaeon]MBT4460446.1 amino acid permease [archaeon]MBT4858465.1 amino acid permease [archaeon]
MIKKHKRKAITLKRDLGLFEAVIAGVGIIVGAGIYVLIGAAAGHAGNMVWASFLIAGFVAFLTGLSYAELSSIYDEDSGEYSYVEHAFGRMPAFIIGYLVMFAGVIGSATVALGFAGYLSSIIGQTNLIVTALIAIFFLTLLNLKGIKQSMKLNAFLTIASVLGLLLIIGLALPYFGKNNFFEYTSLKGIFKASSLIFFAYIGFDSIVQLSEETKNPRKNIPLALLISIAISTIIYGLAAFASISVLDISILSSSVSPLADVAKALLGSKAGFLLAVIAIFATLNTILLEIVAVSRMIYGMSRKYRKINFFSIVNKKTQTPNYAILLAAVLMGLFVMTGNINLIAETTNFAVFIIFATINLALIELRYSKHRKEKFHEPFSIGKFPVLALLGLITSLLMLINLEIKVILYGICLIISGVILYFIIEEK